MQAEMGMERSIVMGKGSEIKSTIEELTIMVVKVTISVGSNNNNGNNISCNNDHVDSAYISTSPFISVCYLVIQVLDMIGPTMAVLRQDMDQNIQITRFYGGFVTTFGGWFWEEHGGSSGGSLQCYSKTMAWLDFFCRFQSCSKIVPDNRTLINILKGKDEDLDKLKEDLQALLSLIVPLVEQIHFILRSYSLDRLKSISEENSRRN